LGTKPKFYISIFDHWPDLSHGQPVSVEYDNLEIKTI